MNIFESARESPIRVTQRFFGTVRLYRLEPNPEIIWEWKFVESTLLEIPIPTVEDGKIETICVGWRLGSLRVGNGVPDQPIKSRSKLMSKLAEYEWQDGIGNPFLGGLAGSKACDIATAVFVISNDRPKGVIGKHCIPFTLECDEVVSRSLDPAPAIFKSSLTHAR